MVSHCKGEEGIKMILFFCGAPKNASHFQMFIVQEALSQKGTAFSNPGNDIFHNHELEAGKKLLEHLDGLSEEMFLCKGHWGSQVERDILLSYENIRIFLIWRDVRDALVSQYFYDINKFGKSYRDFSRFYWWTGRLFLLQQISYRHVWTVTQDPRIQNSSFVELKQNFVEAASKLLAFANIQRVDLEDLDRRLALDRLSFANIQRVDLEDLDRRLALDRLRKKT